MGCPHCRSQGLRGSGHNRLTCPLLHPPPAPPEGTPLWKSGAPLPDGEEMIVGERALCDLLHCSRSSLETQLRLPIDPLPARYMPGGTVVFRNRLRLWLERYPYAPHAPAKGPVAPNPSIPHLMGRETIAAWIGISVVRMNAYRKDHGLPAYVSVGNERVWAYEEALKDWLDVMSVSLRMRAVLLEARRAGSDIPLLHAGIPNVDAASPTIIEGE